MSTPSSQPSGDTATTNAPSRNQSYHEYVARHRIFLTACTANPNQDFSSAHQLWRQMVIGFTCAGIIGLILLAVGTVFIAEAVKSDQPIVVMLCVMGIVFGTILLVGAVILDRHLISRKCKKCQHGGGLPTSQCFHTCSVIYSPSLDQIGPNDPATVEHPPAYESVISILLHPVSSESGRAGGDPENEDCPIMVLPPKYEDAMRPLPDYSERPA